MLLGRGFEPVHPTDINTIALPFSHFPVNSFAVQRTFWQSWGKLRAFDVFLANISNKEKFHLYTNQAGLDFIRLFISHKNCSGFSYLEEGLYSYFTAEKVNNELCPSGSSSVYYKILKHLNFCGRLAGTPKFFTKGYAAVYGLNNESFPEFENRIVLNTDFNLPGKYQKVAGHILAFDAHYEYGHISKAAFEQGIEKVFSYFRQQGINRIWVKYHPEQYANASCLANIRSILAKYKDNLTVDELPQNCCLEYMAADKSSNVNFYVFLSSVGLYAGLAGKKVFSFARFIGDQDQLYQKRIEKLPEVYSRYVEFL